jgi:hypothetical protein
MSAQGRYADARDKQDRLGDAMEALHSAAYSLRQAGQDERAVEVDEILSRVQITAEALDELMPRLRDDAADERTRAMQFENHEYEQSV